MKENKFLEKIAAFGRRVGRRNWVIIGAVILIGGAICLNFILFGGSPANGFDYDGEETQASGNPSGGDNATDAGKEDGYFSSVQVSRQRARDEALEVLQSVVENENADEAAKNEALAQISQLAGEMEQESNIETLVLAKGFEACVAVVSDGSASIVVKCAEGKLVPSQISQINEIVYEQAGIEPVNINIIER
ncbi:MAG: SpoIIIAH-like family protein [Clostridia bacterium]|nr:SpoIIIAH-like family protein [Clostridia bacterium]MBR2908510.1 SpoIIIAH-like family protein [Clostridia bacterium]